MYRQFHEVRDAFYVEHGEYVVTPEGPVIFKDGAVDENSYGGMGPLVEPPTDAWERNKLILLFWQIRAEQTRQAFLDYKRYLQGTGRCPAEAERFYSDEQHLELLARYRKRAQTAKRYMRSAREAVDEAEPAKFKHLRQAEAERQSSKQKFLNQVERVRI